MVKTGFLSAVMLVTLFAIIGTSKAVPHNHKPACGNTACITVYQPVCGSDGETYSNSCFFDIEKRCKNPALTVRCQGDCSEC
ncbi:protease inhibitor 2-like isoform X2 [Macrobrachium nipponense]|uniref:protease inhibitor 2-like isoform X2 n=1 Tax=Macrobrachium nipponense TaxID=159736 RepID=UPI0030C81510